MAWPHPTDYNEAIQNPALCFRDEELRQARVVEDALGVPRPYSGNFADVYQLRGPDGRGWAVKCFTREVVALQPRYQAVSDHLRQGSPPFMVNFRYLADGMRVRGKVVPVLKMDWVEGHTLNEFVRKYADSPPVMYRLAQMWVKLSLQLRRAHMAHADLQHGNVILVPGERASQLSLRLIDYDGMFVPALAGSPSGEVGHPNYQHPQRLREGTYGPELDRFPHLVIYTALRCLTVGGRDLWDRFDNGENLLFREQDFARPVESQLLLELWQLPDPDIRRLLGHLLLGSLQPLDRVALLDEVVGSEGRPLGLSVGQERQVLELLPPAAARMKNSGPVLSRYSLEELIADIDQPWSAMAAGGKRSAGGAVAVATEPAAAAETGAPPRRRTGLHAPPAPIIGETRERAADRPLLPGLRLPCLFCGQRKHVLESLCPACGKPDFATLALTGLAAAAVLGLALFALPGNEPGIVSVLGFLAGAAALVLVPTAVGLLVNVLSGRQKQHPDAVAGPRWPGKTATCLRCGRVNTMPVFVCRLCGRISWVLVAVAAAVAAVALGLVAFSQSVPDAPAWWLVPVALLRWFGRLLGCLATLALLIGTLEIWKLQTRLPPEGRVRTPAAQLALAAATLLPVLFALVLVFGLF